MIDIAFLGSDSTHAEEFAQRINKLKSPFSGVARVVSIWGEDKDQTREKAKCLSIKKVCESPEQALENVDLAMVIGRFGDSHMLPTKLALERGIPTFVDKPFTSSFAEARELVALAERSGTPLLSCSPLRFCSEVKRLIALRKEKAKLNHLLISGPANCIELGDDSRFGSIFFFGIHVVEILHEILGDQFHNEEIEIRRDTISVYIESGSVSATLYFVRNTKEFYSMQYFAGAEMFWIPICLDGSYYVSLLRFLFEEFLTGKNTIPQLSTLRAIDLLDRIEQKRLQTSF